MGAPNSASMAPSSSSSNWRLGDNEQLMSWVRGEAAELSKPREFSARDLVAKDLRVLFIALMPYEFARFKTEAVQLLSEFSGFQTDTIQSFKTRMIFAKLKLAEMDSKILDQICGYFGLEPKEYKIDQIDKLVNLLARPENLCLNEEKLELLQYLSRVENVKIPGSRRHLALLKYPPRSRASSAAKTHHQSIQSISENEDDESKKNCDESGSQTKQRKTKRQRSSPKEHSGSDADNTTQKKKSKSNTKGHDEDQAVSDDNSSGADKHVSESASQSEAKLKQQLRKTIRSYLEKSDVDVTMRMVKEHLLEHYGKEVLQTHKSYIKNTVMEIIERL